METELWWLPTHGLQKAPCPPYVLNQGLSWGPHLLTLLTAGTDSGNAFLLDIGVSCSVGYLTEQENESNQHPGLSDQD